MCRAKKEENNGAAPLRSVSGEVFATFASLLLVALVLMCMLQTGLSCAYFAQERKSALTAVLTPHPGWAASAAGSLSGCVCSGWACCSGAADCILFSSSFITTFTLVVFGRANAAGPPVSHRNNREKPAPQKC